MKRIDAPAQNHFPAPRPGAAEGLAAPQAATSPLLVPPRRVSLIRLLLLSLAAALFLAGVPAFAVSPLGLDVLLKGIQAGTKPWIEDDVLILSYSGQPRTRSVSARFEHEGFSRLHEFSRNEFGVFILDYRVPRGVRQIRYRICVDGLWMNDPHNPAVVADEMGTEFSLVTLEREPPRPLANPRIESGGRVTFEFRGRPSGRVTIAGDWNCWDPFSDEMRETEPGMYTISLRMRPGAHWYFFLADGLRVLDAANPATGRDPDGRPVSYFSFAPG